MQIKVYLNYIVSFTSLCGYLVCYICGGMMDFNNRNKSKILVGKFNLIKDMEVFTSARYERLVLGTDYVYQKESKEKNVIVIKFRNYQYFVTSLYFTAIMYLRSNTIFINIIC